MRRLALVSLLVLTVPAAACGGAARHPLDDSEPRPPSLEAAEAEARAELDEIGEVLLRDATHEDSQWQHNSGCGVAADSPEQGEVSRVLRVRYTLLPPGTTATEIVSGARSHWEAGGRTVSAGSASMPLQAVTRINGISYAVVDVAPGVELRAFLPCFGT